jgi:flagellar basal body P-ring formation protein FlgA
MKTLFLIAAATATTPTFENLDNLDARIAAFIGSSSASGNAVTVDRRLRLSACNQAAEISWLDSNSIAVRCATPNWRLRVSVMNASAVESKNERPAIKRGDMVEARYEADDFDLSASMIALEDGRTGDSIRVKNPDSGRPVIGVVTGAGTVLISR